MDTKVAKLLNDQVTKELDSAYIYLAMATYFDEKGLPGMAHWMKKQYAEEVTHGMKIMGYMNDRAVKITLGTIAKPASEYSSVKAVFQASLKHEKYVTASINTIYEAAFKANDFATVELLNWFVKEQVEEEKNVSDILIKLDYIKDSSMGLIFLDKELGARQ